MKKPEQLTPTVQVLARSFAVLDVLAAHQDPVDEEALTHGTSP